MTTLFTADVTANLLTPLMITAVRSLAVAGVAGLGLVTFRVKSASLRLFTWTAVLYAALAMPVLERILPRLPVPIATFLKAETARSAESGNGITRSLAIAPFTDKESQVGGRAPGGGSPRFARSSIRWAIVATVVYFAGLLFLMFRLLVGMVFGGRLRRASQVIRETRITTRFEFWAKFFELSVSPAVAESEFISIPVTMGIVRPVIFLPICWREWDDAKLDTIAAHEVSHIARRDTLTQRLSQLHCAIFWFSPLAWWLNRRLADLAEQVSDEAALSGGADRTAYASTLLGFFEALQGSRRRVWWQGVSMASAGRAEERVERILEWKGTVAMNLKKSIAVVVVTLAVPIVYLAASAQTSGRQAEGVALVAIAQAKTPPAAPGSHAVRAPRKSSSHSSYRYSDDGGQEFVIVSGQSDSLTMSGTGIDGEEVGELRKKIPGDFIWFRHDGKSYIIRDQATINRARSFWAPQEELGKRQEELGQQQEALGKQQEELGAKMEQVRVDVPDMTKELEKLQATVKNLNSSATSDQIAELQSQIGDLQEKIGESQSRAGEEQSKLGEQMSALGEKQGKLGEQQGALGRKQGELAEQASRQMKQLFGEAIAKGTAQEEK